MGLVYLIGLTGGIASGKSRAAERLAALGGVHIDADKLARAVVEPGGDALAKIVDEFGPRVLLADGSLNRPQLGSIIFPDADRRAVLNGITHPAVKELAASLIAEAVKADKNAVIVYDVPLLVEAGVRDQHQFDLIVVVHASAQTRVDRLIAQRGMSRQDAAARISSQASDAERLAIADVVINNDGTLDELILQVDQLWCLASSTQ